MFFKKIKNLKIKKIYFYIEILALAAGVLTTFLFYAHYEKILGNSASRFLLVLGPYLGIGKPYTNLWEFVPPGFLTFASFWVFLFGWSMTSLRVLQVLLLASIGIMFLFILKKIFKSESLIFITYLSFVAIFYSPIIQTDMLSIELFAVSFVLVALTSLLYIKDSLRKLFFSAFFFFLASQMKETFTFAVVAMVPYFLLLLSAKGFSKDFFKNVLSAILGVMVAALIVTLYLYLVGGWSGYQSVINYKLDRVQPFGTWGDIYAKFKFIELVFSENFLHWHHFISRLVLIHISIAVIYGMVRFKLLNRTKEVFEFSVKLKTNKSYSWFGWSGILFSLGIFFGLIMYGQYSVDTRQIPVAVAFFILVGLLLDPLIDVVDKWKMIKFWFWTRNFVVFLILLTFLSPQKKVIHAFLHQIRLHVKAEIFGNYDLRKFYITTSSTEVNDYIASKTTPHDCILNPYGWEVAETYIYSGRKPCSRHFLSNLLVGEKWQMEEYKKEIFQNPPKLILYNLNMIDLNLDNFRENVIDYDQVLKHCYVIDNKYQKFPYVISSSTTYIDLYWKKPEMNDDEFKTCVGRYGNPSMSESKVTKDNHELNLYNTEL